MFLKCTFIKITKTCKVMGGHKNEENHMSSSSLGWYPPFILFLTFLLDTAFFKFHIEK